MKALKKLFVAALAVGPLAALAQDAAKPPPPPAAVIYGTLNVNLQDVWSGGATTTAPGNNLQGRMAVSIDSSNIGVKGSMALNDDVAATYQCETGAAVNGIGNAALCNRNSRLGLTLNNIGTIWYGNWDTPYKAQIYGTKADDPFGKTDVWGFNTIFGSPGFNYRSGAWKTGAAGPEAIRGFDIRAQSSVGFHSASFAGVSFKVQAGTDFGRDQTKNYDPWLVSAVVNYDQGPVALSAAWETHGDGFGLNGIGQNFGATAAASNSQQSRDNAWRVAAGYEIVPNTVVSALVEQLDFKSAAPTTTPANSVLTEYKRFAWGLQGKTRFGPHELRARYAQAQKGTVSGFAGTTAQTLSADGYGAKNVALGYAYIFSPKAELYLHYNQIMNEKNAQYTFSIGGPTPFSQAGGTIAKGSDPKAIGLGMRYSF